MNDKEFLNRVKIGVETYQKENIWDHEEERVLDDFLTWIYKEYGFVKDTKDGQS